ncbi:MAG TPA: FAD:protein FMN transferase [Candidatus Dormibacteraeota bacterium]|nr:FAD:protein FMN transferase [Candidatus Dormibacteraeota bacterium]
MQYYQTNTALGSEVTLSVVDQDDELKVSELFSLMWRTIFNFERQFSRFLPASELSLFNRNAGSRQFISAEFKDILLAAYRLSQETAGLYNPFILPALQAAGYDHSLVPGYENDQQDDHSRKSVVSIDQLKIGSSWAIIPYGTAIDLGGCGKGYLGDLLASLIEKKVIGYWLSLGGDVVTGGVDDSGNGWKVAIQRATQEGEGNIGYVSCPLNKRFAVASSGIIKRHGQKDGKAWHHLIDPRTLLPAITDVHIATICDKSALRADVIASSAVIIGSRQAKTLLKNLGINQALLQLVNKNGRSSQIKCGRIIHLD